MTNITDSVLNCGRVITSDTVRLQEHVDRSTGTLSAVLGDKLFRKRFNNNVRIHVFSGSLSETLSRMSVDTDSREGVEGPK